MSEADKQAAVSGRNGVAITQHQRRGDGSGYRTYEVYQRERVGESTEKIKPAQLNSDAYRTDPYPLLEVLRENYPCYRDWLNNCYWVSQYNDVTSIFADEANFESRSCAWYYGQAGKGRDFSEAVAVQTALTRTFDENVVTLTEQLLTILQQSEHPDLVIDLIGPLAAGLLGQAFAVADADQDQFAEWFWQMKRGAGWDARLQQQGKQAMQALTQYFAQRLLQIDADPDGSVLAVMKTLDAQVNAEDVVATLLEQDHQTLHGGLANMWYLLLAHPDEYAKITDQRLMKVAYLEAMRHSTPVITAERFTRHEVERFGRLLPKGAQVRCSAAGANRDPRIFADPDQFIVDRVDLCQREPRGQYRADGLATGICFALGRPSIHPAVPEDRPRSRYALIRDTAVAASMQIHQALPELRIAQDASPHLSSLTVGEMHTCWRLPVAWR